MRVSKVIATGWIIEAQSGGTEADLEILYSNAVALGYARDDVVASVMDDATFFAEQSAQDIADHEIAAAATLYRERRAAAYQIVLAKVPGSSEIEVIGDMIDIIMTQVGRMVLGQPPSAEFLSVAQKVAAVKAEFPPP